MAWLRVIWTVSFIIVPIAAGVFGYHRQGWLRAVLFPIDAVILVMSVPIGVLIAVTWAKNLSDRSRISRLSTDQLRALVETPANRDFSLAFLQLSKRGIDTKPARQLLLEMLTSNVGRERTIALRRLEEIYPAIRHRFFYPPVEGSPEQFRTQVESILVGASRR